VTVLSTSAPRLRTRTDYLIGTKPRCGRCTKAVSETVCIYDLERGEHSYDERTTPRFKSSAQGSPRISDASQLNLSPAVGRDFQHSHGENHQHSHGENHQHSHGDNQRILLLEQQVKELQTALAASQARETPQKDTSPESRTVSNVLGLCFIPQLINHCYQRKTLQDYIRSITRSSHTLR